MPRVPQIIEHSKLVYYMGVSYDGEYLFANQFFLDRFKSHGLNDGSLKIKDTIVSEDWGNVVELFEKAKRHPGKAFEIIIRKPAATGEIVHTSWEFMADESKREILCIGFDISQRIAYSKKAWEFGRKINQIIDSVTDGFYSLDNNWCFTLVNKSFLDTVNMSRQQLIGKSIWEVFPNDKNYKYPRLYRRAKKEGVAEKFEDYRSDLHKWHWVAAYPTDDGLIVFFKDITERKIERAELVESRNKLSAILNSTSEAHILIAPDYSILSFNETAKQNTIELYGIDLKQGLSILEFTMPNTVDQFVSDFKKALAGKVVRVEIPITFPKGQKRWFRIEFSPALAKDGSIIGVVFNSMDIDELKQYECGLEKSNEQLRAIAHQQSHEMRSPIAQVLGLMNLLKNSPGDVEIMEHIERVAHQLDTIVHEIIEKTEEA